MSNSSDTKFGQWPHHSEEELVAVKEVLSSGKTNYWTGNVGREFEREYAEYLGRNHAIALHNGSLALELALVALNVGPGDEVITTARTFIASASVIVMRGATPVIVDVERDSGNLSVKTVEPAITSRTKAIIPVHIGGWPVDMAPLMQLAKTHGIAVIEDAAQAHGATIDGKPVGSFGDFAAFSFCQDKIITTGGEGGLLALNDETAWRKAWAFKDHGKSYEAVYEREHPAGFRWLHESFGTNWRMLEMQAAIGRIQLHKLPETAIARRTIGAAYEQEFAKLNALRVPHVPANMEHAYYRSYVYVEPDALRTGWSRDRIITEVNARGVPCFSGSCSEIYLEKAFVDAQLGPKERLPIARELGETSLAFQCHPTITQEGVDLTIGVVRDVMAEATR